MNRKLVLFNLKEAKEELDRTIEAIEKDSRYGVAEYMVAMSHLYHHLNTAWNARRSSDRRAKNCSEKDFEDWREFPKEFR